MGEVGKGIRLLKEAGCEEVVFAGTVKRPDLSALKFDLAGRRAAARADRCGRARAMTPCLRVVAWRVREGRAFRVVGADDVLAALLAPAGPLGNHVVRRPRTGLDIRIAAARLRRRSACMDVGQGAVARDGGGARDRNGRTAPTPCCAACRRAGAVRGGVLVKRPKPHAGAAHRPADHRRRHGGGAAGRRPRRHRRRSRRRAGR